MCSPGREGVAASGKFVLFCRAAQDVEQAAAIGTDHAFGAGRAQAFDFVADDGFGDFRIADGKGAAEAAALLVRACCTTFNLSRLASSAALVSCEPISRRAWQEVCSAMVQARRDPVV